MKLRTQKIIALLTDFGLEDYYVASLKGVIASINPAARVIDICHSIQPQNIQQGAFVLREVYPYFPNGTIFVAVVDPGVGSKRVAICVKSKKGFLMGPDNGILSLALESESSYEVRKIINDQFFRKPVSSTFHGRDIFAPVAAHLSLKNRFTELGPQMNSITKGHFGNLGVSSKKISGEIVYVDRFGNAITNIKKELLNAQKKNITLCEIKLKSFRLKQIHRFFSEAKTGELIAIWNSSGYLEFAVPNDSAEKRFKLKAGDGVGMSWE